MKIIINSIVIGVAVVAGTVLQAADGELTAVPQLHIASVSQEKIDLFKQVLIKQQATRRKCQYAIGALAAIPVSYAAYDIGTKIYYWWNTNAQEEAEKKRTTQDQLVNVRDANDSLRKRVFELEKHLPLAKNYVGNWYNRWFHRVKDWTVDTVSFLPSFGTGLLGFAALDIARSIIMPNTINALDYLFEGRTIGWCIETQTKFRQAVRDLSQWCDALLTYPGGAHELTALAARMNIFVSETEKILAFMEYMTAKLSPHQDNEKESAQSAMATIREAVEMLVKKTNDVLVNESALNSIEKRQEILTTIKTSVYAIISEMASFEAVEFAAGYQNLRRINTFDTLHALLIPEVQKLRAQIREARVLAEETQNMRGELENLKEFLRPLLIKVGPDAQAQAE